MSEDYKTGYLKALDRIVDLEAKLTEYEEFMKENNLTIGKITRILSNVELLNKLAVYNENQQLKQQLAEKEKEIENIKLCRCVNCTNEYEFMLEGLVEDLEKQIDKDEQDKILFAVEQLEEFKEFLNTTNKTGSYVYYGDCWTTKIDKDSLLNKIGNQIASLKKGVE